MEPFLFFPNNNIYKTYFTDLKMRKEVVKLIFAVLIFTFLLSQISAVDFGTCEIVTSSECNNTSNSGYIVMGLSSVTNAHGQFPYVNYPYVLCCNFGTGNTNCINGMVVPNIIVNLSSATNAHAELYSKKNYHTGVCYEDVACEKKQICSETQIGILSLSADTNAHIGNFSDYPTKICCSGSAITQSSCTIKSVSWDTTEAISGQNVYLQVEGSGIQCIGQTIILNVSGGSEEIINQPMPIMFTDVNVMGSWTAEHQKCGIWPFETDCNYYFEASLENNPSLKLKSNEPDLSVSERLIDNCIEVDSCTDYDNKLDCNSDATVCDVAENSDPDIACESESFYCGCVWNENSTGTEEDPKCKFGYTEITEETCGSPIEGQGCGFGCTLCDNNLTGKYCNVGSSCPSGIKPTNNNGSCDFGIDSCGSADCGNGNQDSCAEGTYCVLDKCGNIIGPPISLGSCRITQQISKGCEEEPVGYKMVTLNAEWTGETSGTQYENCIAKDNQQVRISCPAQVQLPFFDTLGIIIAILAIVLVYIIIVYKRKNKHRKNKK